jgi:hypothetical protein
VLNDLSSSLGAPVSSVELEGQRQDDEDRETVSDHGSLDAGPIGGEVRDSEDGAANDAANATEANEGCRAKGSLPLPTDVIGLVGQNGWDVSVATDGSEEGTEVADAIVGSEAQEWKTN